MWVSGFWFLVSGWLLSAVAAKNCLLAAKTAGHEGAPSVHSLALVLL
jgi:hypothetical protein